MPNACGRGPINDMSPLRMFKSWGNSSSEVRRRKRPIGVILGSSLVVWATPEMSQRSIYIERNLKISMGLPSMPSRLWRNSAGPPLVNRMASAISNNAGASIKRVMALMAMSMMRFKTSCMLRLGVGDTGAGSPFMKVRGRPECRETRLPILGVDSRPAGKT